MPAYTADYFGAKHMGGICGWILLAWGVGGVVCPNMIARIRQAAGSYSIPIHITADVLVVSLLLPLIVRRPKGKEIGRPESGARAS
jgi:OFA family oxalate/formate antiporter-like MFS transporter